MIARLPHPTKTGVDAYYVVEDNPGIPTAWFDEYATIGASLRPFADDPRTELEQRLWRLLHRAHTTPTRSIRTELRRALEVVDRIEQADDERHQAMADQLWDRAAEMAGRCAA